MAKTRSKQIEKKSPMKECWVKLKRMSRSEIERFLKPKPNVITHNIDAKINKQTLKMGKAKITSENLVFDVQMKLRKDKITITRSQSSTSSFKPKTSKNSTKMRNQKSNLTVAVLQPKPIIKLIEEAWQKCKLDRHNEFHLNDLVLAKLKGHAAWPAVIVDFVNKSKAKVEFLGANPNEKFGFVTLKEIVHYRESVNVIRLTLKRDFIHIDKC